MTMFEKLWRLLPDRCEVIDCERKGVRGNENIVGGRIVCDYCYARKGNLEFRKTLRQRLSALKMKRSDPPAPSSFRCTSEHPWSPALGHPAGVWHPSAREVSDARHGSMITYDCPFCGYRWSVEPDAVMSTRSHFTFTRP